MFKTISIKGKEYQLRLTLKSVMALENALKSNPVNILIQAQAGTVPKVSDLMLIFHYSLQELNNNIPLEESQKIFEEYFEEGNSLFNMAAILADVLSESGIIGKKE